MLCYVYIIILVAYNHGYQNGVTYPETCLLPDMVLQFKELGGDRDVQVWLLLLINIVSKNILKLQVRYQNTNVILLGEVLSSMLKRLLEPLIKVLVESLVCTASINQANINNQAPYISMCQILLHLVIIYVALCGCDGGLSQSSRLILVFLNLVHLHLFTGGHVL